MNEETHSVVRENITEESSQRNIGRATTNLAIDTITSPCNDVQIPTRSTYASFFWLLNYLKMFLARLGKDLYHSILWYFQRERVLPDHIADLMRVQQMQRMEHDSRTATYSRYNIVRRSCSTVMIERSTQIVSLVPESTGRVRGFPEVLQSI